MKQKKIMQKSCTCFLWHYFPSPVQFLRKQNNKNKNKTKRKETHKENVFVEGNQAHAHPRMKTEIPNLSDNNLNVIYLYKI